MRITCSVSPLVASSKVCTVFGGLFCQHKLLYIYYIYYFSIFHVYDFSHKIQIQYNIVNHFHLNLYKDQEMFCFTMLTPNYVKNNLTQNECKFQLHSSTQLNTLMSMELQIHNMNTFGWKHIPKDFIHQYHISIHHHFPLT